METFNKMNSKNIFPLYVIKNKKDLNQMLNEEIAFYKKYMYNSKYKYILGLFRKEPITLIIKWQRLSRKTDLYDYLYHTTGSLFYFCKYIWFFRKKNILGNKIGIEMSTRHVDKGLVLYHFNNVINGNTIIGKNCHIHGTVVIGNSGPNDLRCPKIGNNVMVGAGAKIIGNVTIADNIKVAAGAVVVNSFNEPGITIGGVPAKKIK